MKILRFDVGQGPRYGIVEEEQIFALQGDPFAAFTRGAKVARLDQVKILPPVQPSKVLAVGKNYAEHIREMTQRGAQADLPKSPILFLKAPSAIIGHGENIVYPTRATKHVDHEAELVVVIGKRARHVSVESALDYVLGYTCGNDVSARDLQRDDGQWMRSKSFDTFAPLGPWIATDLNPLDLGIQARVNGLVKQNSRTSQMIFNVPTLVAFASQAMTLEPGDVIMTGTPDGVSPIKPGDAVEIEIEGIGVLRNAVVAE